MYSLVVEKKQIVGKRIVIDDSGDINHIKNVLRLEIGEDLRVVDGDSEYLTTIERLEKRELELSIKEQKIDNYSLNIKIDACIGVIKNDKMDLIIQKLTEIGINRIIPIITKRSVVKIDEKKDKWDKISKEALKQCRGVKFIEIGAPVKINELDFNEYDLVILLYEKETSLNIMELLRQKNNIKRVLYVIGPEGGFEEEEIEALIAKGAKTVTLGNRILRAETAAIVVGGILANAI